MFTLFLRDAGNVITTWPGVQRVWFNLLGMNKIALEMKLAKRIAETESGVLRDMEASEDMKTLCPSRSSSGF